MINEKSLKTFRNKLKDYFLIGLTGVCGSGKSSALDFFSKHGFSVCSADKITHYLLTKEKCYSRILIEFGSGVSYKGVLDKTKLAKLVFRDNAKRRWLENFIHPLILKEIINQVKKSGKKISIIEAPLLFESGLDSVMNVNICVYSKMDLIYERLKKRGWEIKEIEKRLKSQYSQDKKIFLSDISIENNGSLKDLEIKIRDLSQVLSRFQI